MDAPVLIAIIGILAAPIASFVTWFLNRKKHVADFYNAVSESSQMAVETMQMTMNELRIGLVDAKAKIEELISENELLREDLHILKSQNERLIQENKYLESKMEKLYQHIKNIGS
jgi:predicted nuclease with TOPRIM domain